MSFIAIEKVCLFESQLFSNAPIRAAIETDIMLMVHKTSFVLGLMGQYVLRHLYIPLPTVGPLLLSVQ